jgi:hypothetical protein
MAINHREEAETWIRYAKGELGVDPDYRVDQVNHAAATVFALVAIAHLLAAHLEPTNTNIPHNFGTPY